MMQKECHITVIPIEKQHQPFAMQVLLDCIAIREQVFVEEQQVPIAIEQDGKDNESGHILLWIQGVPVGTLRFRQTTEGMKLERIAVLKPYRGRHLGKLLIREGLRAVRMSGSTDPVYLHAQQHAALFYHSLGFVETGEQITEAGIPHVTMKIPLEAEDRCIDSDPHASMPCGSQASS